MGFWIVEWRIECHSPHPSVRAKEAHTSGLAGTDGDLRSDRVLGQETGTIRSFTVDTGGTIRMRAQATRSVFCRAESASVADSAEWVFG